MADEVGVAGRESKQMGGEWKITWTSHPPISQSSSVLCGRTTGGGMSRCSTDHREWSWSPRKRGESGTNGEFLDEGNGVETEGSDGDSSFLGSDVESVVEMEAVDEGNSKQEWQVKTNGKKKDKKRGHDDVHTESDKKSDAKRVARQIDLKVKVQFDSPSSINPLKITKALHEAVGTVRVTPLRDGSLIIECSNITQRDKLLGMNEMEGKKKSNLLNGSVKNYSLE